MKRAKKARSVLRNADAGHRIPSDALVGGLRGFSNILVLVAMDVEKKAILSRFSMSNVRQKLPLDLEVRMLERRGATIYLTTTGVGLANAAISTAILSDKLAIDAILLLGVGGSLSPVLQIGDVVIGSRTLQHDSRYTSASGHELMAPGELHLSLPPDQRPSPFMGASAVWISWLADATRKFPTYTGTMLSGSEFVGDPARKIELAKFADDALLVDMEAASVAQIARKLSIPFGVAKTVSDRLNPDGSIETDYKRFLKKSAERSLHIFQRLVADVSR